VSSARVMDDLLRLVRHYLPGNRANAVPTGGRDET
jgi:hypothetical protein